MQLFAGRFYFNVDQNLDLVNGIKPRINYDDLAWSLMTTFQGLMGDGWENAMYLGTSAIGMQTCIFHGSLYLVGKILVFHLSVAVLLCIFRLDKSNSDSNKLSAIFKERVIQGNREVEAKIRPFENELKNDKVSDQPKLVTRRSLNIPENDTPKLFKLKTFHRGKNTSIASPVSSGDINSSKSELALINSETRVQLINEEGKTTRILLGSEKQDLEKINESENELERNESFYNTVYNYAKESSLFIFHRSWCLRIFLLKWVQPFDDELYYSNENYFEDIQFTRNMIKLTPATKKDKIDRSSVMQSNYLQQRKKRAVIFESIMLFFVFCSIVVQILDNPITDPESKLKVFCFYAEVFFACLFCLEAFIKIIAMGFFFSSSKEVPAYAFSGWNILDFFVTLVTILNVTLSTKEKILKALKAIRVLRIIRPLKTITKSEHLKLLLTSVIVMIPSIVYLSILMLFYVFSVGIITTYAFKGRMYKCSLIDDSIATRANCEANNGKWVLMGYGFDNIGNSILSLIQIVSCDGWWNLMLHMIDAREIDQTPADNTNKWWALFVIIYLLIGTIVFMGMYTCIFFEFFNKGKLEYSGAANCSLEEQQWINIQRFMLRRTLKKKVQIPSNECRYKCFILAKGLVLEIANTIVIICIIVMYFLRDNNTSGIQNIVADVFLYICTACINFTFFIKFLGLGYLYFQYAWNKYSLR